MWQTWILTHSSLFCHEDMKIGLLKIKLLIHYEAAPDQRRAMCSRSWTFYFLFCQEAVGVCLFFCFFFNCFFVKVWLHACFISNFLTDLTISKSILVSHPSCGWQIWDTANVYVGFTDAVTLVNLCWPGCRLCAESVLCSSVQNLQYKSNNFKAAHFLGLTWCVCAYLFFSFFSEKEINSFFFSYFHLLLFGLWSNWCIVKNVF